MDRREFGALIAEWRFSYRNPDAPDEPLSLRRLAKLVKVAHTTLSRVERGQRPFSWNLVADLDRVLQTGGDLERAARELDDEPGQWPQVIPNQLPPAPMVFGRDQLLEAIEAAARASAQQVVTPVIVLTGAGGSARQPWVLSPGIAW